MKQPLYGHTSPETAYLVVDYPYGRTLRCRLRAWLEFSPAKGYRHVTQTEHPTSKKWNAPRNSTYVRVAACMYLDEKGHLHWEGVHEYTSEQEALAFVRNFPQCEGRGALLAWAKRKALVAKNFASGVAYIVVNGQRQVESEARRAVYAEEATVWEEVVRVLKSVTSLEAAR